MSVEVDLSQFVAGGYFITKPIDRPEYLSNSSGPSLPERFFSLSQCLTDFLPGPWVWENWDKRVDRAKAVGKWGIDTGRTTEVIEWVQSKYVSGEMGRIHVFCNLNTPRGFLKYFDVPTNDLILIGIALHRSDSTRFMESEKPGHGIVSSGEFEMISRGHTVNTGGIPLGFEPLVLDGWGLFHSWLCNSLQETAFEQKGIHPNAHGFLDKLEDARWVTDYVNEDPYIRGEPGLWLPWLVMTYPLQ